MEGEGEEEECGHVGEIEGGKVWVDDDGVREVYIGDTEVDVALLVAEDFGWDLVEFDDDGDTSAKFNYIVGDG